MDAKKIIALDKNCALEMVQAGDVLTFYLVGEAITLPADGAYTKSGAEQDVPVASAVYVTKNK